MPGGFGIACCGGGNAQGPKVGKGWEGLQEPFVFANGELDVHVGLKRLDATNLDGLCGPQGPRTSSGSTGKH